MCVLLFHAGLGAPAFASVTPGTLDKPLRRLVEEIVRAQPAGRGTAAAGTVAPEAAAAGGEKVKEFTLLGADGEAVTSGDRDRRVGGTPVPGHKPRQWAPPWLMLPRALFQPPLPAMGGEELRETLRARVEAKRREKARGERRAAARDDTDRLREALRGGKKGGGRGGVGSGKQQQQSRGFG